MIFADKSMAEGLRKDHKWYGRMRYINADGSYVITELNLEGQRDGVYEYYDPSGDIIDFKEVVKDRVKVHKKSTFSRDYTSGY